MHRALGGCVLQVVQRAREEDLNRPIIYEVAFIRNGAGRVVTDVRRRLLSLPLCA